MVNGEGPESIRLDHVNRREADSQDGLMGNEGVEREEGGDEAVAREKKKITRKCLLISGTIVVLAIIGIVFVMVRSWSSESTPSINATQLISSDTTTTTTTTARQVITEPFLLCAPSEIPSVGNVSTSHPFGTIEQTEWNDKLHFLPCMNAIGYNKALMDQFVNWMENGLWIIQNGTMKMKNETGGKDKFMNSFFQFALSLSGIHDGYVTVNELIEKFGKDFDKVRCIHIKREEKPLYFPCDEAVFNDSLSEKDLFPFSNSALHFIRYIQSKVLLYTTALGEMESTMPGVILEIKDSDFLNDFFVLAMNDHRPEMIKFLNELNFEQAKIIGMSGQKIIKRISDCMKESNPESGQTWKKYFSETCLNFGDGINWNVVLAKGGN